MITLNVRGDDEEINPTPARNTGHVLNQLPVSAPADLESCPVGKEGTWSSLFCPSTMVPREDHGVWGPVAHKNRNVTINVGVDDINELCIAGI
jgi:hypothetical protein